MYSQEWPPRAHSVFVRFFLSLGRAACCLLCSQAMNDALWLATEAFFNKIWGPLGSEGRELHQQFFAEGNLGKGDAGPSLVVDWTTEMDGRRDLSLKTLTCREHSGAGLCRVSYYLFFILHFRDVKYLARNWRPFQTSLGFCARRAHYFKLILFWRSFTQDSEEHVLVVYLSYPAFCCRSYLFQYPLLECDSTRSNWSSSRVWEYLRRVGSSFLYR